MKIPKLKTILKSNIFIFREFSYLRLRRQCLEEPALGRYYLNKFFPADFPEKKGKVLDIGCSWGRFGALLAPHDFQVYGIDPFIEQKDFWLKVHKRNKTAYFTAADAQYIPFKDNQFDSSIVVGVLEFFKDDKLFFRELTA